MLSKECEALFQIMKASKEEAKKQKLTPELILQQRKALDETLGLFPIPEEIKCTETKLGNIKVEYCEYVGDQEGADPEKIALFFHGGGFTGGTIASRRHMCTNVLKRAKINGYSVEYTQYPEGKHPQGLMDCIEAFKEVQKLGYKPENIYCFGESAGAMLCLMLTMYLKDHGEAIPGKLCVFSPVINVNEDYASKFLREDRDPVILRNVNSALSCYVDDEYRTSPYISTAYGDFTGFPKLSIHVGSEEVHYDDAIILYYKCKDAGVDVTLKEWEGLFHSFPTMPLPESDEAAEEMAEFFRN